MLERFSTFTIIIVKAVHILLLIVDIVLLSTLFHITLRDEVATQIEEVRTTSKTDNHTREQSSCSVPTEQIKRYTGEHNCSQCKETMVNTLFVIDAFARSANVSERLCVCVFSRTRSKITTDSFMEETYNRKNSSKERRINFPIGNKRIRQAP